MKAVVCLLVAVAVSVAAGVVLGFACGGLGPWSARASLILGVAAAAWAWEGTRPVPPGKPVRGWAAWAVVILFALFALRAFCWVGFFKGDEIAVLSPNNLGDLSIHITYIRNFANGAPFWPENPIFSGERLHYPPGMDLLNALLLLTGVDLLRGLVWAGLLGALASGIALWRWGGAFGIAGFLFNGGLAFLGLFGGEPLAQLQTGVQWKSLPLALLVTQRGFLYALPAGLFLLWSWRERFLRRKRGLPLAIEWLLYATLPLFHLHTFLFLSALLAAWFALSWCGPFWREAFPPQTRRAILLLVALALLPASACVWLLTGGFHSSGFLRWNPGWMQEGNPAVFWLWNFGLFPFLVAALGARLFRLSRSAETRAEAARESATALPAAVFFLVTVFVAFAPWAWDNTKLMLWCYLALLPPLWSMLRGWKPWLSVAACLFLFASGFLSLLEGLGPSQRGHAIARRSELDRLSNPLKEFPSTATFAAFPTYNHPLLLLGRKVAAGYEGHLMSHGIPYQPRLAALRTLMNAEPGWQETARHLGIDYLFWGRLETEAYGPPAWPGQAPQAAHGPWGTVYDLRHLP